MAPESHQRSPLHSRDWKLASHRAMTPPSPRGRVHQPAASQLPPVDRREGGDFPWAALVRTAAPQARSRAQSPHRTDQSAFEKRFTAGNPEQAVTNPRSRETTPSCPNRAADATARFAGRGGNCHLPEENSTGCPPEILRNGCCQAPTRRVVSVGCVERDSASFRSQQAPLPPSWRNALPVAVSGGPILGLSPYQTLTLSQP
jgi:hypothetical protein